MLSILLFSVALGLASAQCGVKSGGFNVVGGEEATPNEWPWQLSLQSSSGSHFCGATLFSTEWVVTAAHCVEGSSPGSVTVVAGEHSLGTNSGNEQRLAVEEISIHPQYNFPDYDVAVIQLRDLAVLNENVGIACTPVLDEDYSDSTCWISGWGLTSGSDIFLPDLLQEVEVDVMTTGECQAEWGNTVNDGIACVQGIGADEDDIGGCNGDSGGPIHCQRDGSWDVVGAASFVFSGCNTQYPTGYCRLTYVWDFIQQVSGLEPST